MGGSPAPLQTFHKVANLRLHRWNLQCITFILGSQLSPNNNILKVPLLPWPQPGGRLPTRRPLHLSDAQWQGTPGQSYTHQVKAEPTPTNTTTSSKKRGNHSYPVI